MKVIYFLFALQRRSEQQTFFFLYILKKDRVLIMRFEVEKIRTVQINQ